MSDSIRDSLPGVPVRRESAPKTITKDAPDHHDAELVLKLYDLRREAVMRESRRAIAAEFWPRSAEDVLAVSKPEHPLNAAFRQVSGYWEMAYGLARHGIVHPDYLAETTGEGLLLFAKVQPYLAAVREANPRAFLGAEWMVEHSETAKGSFAYFQGRVRATLERK